MKTQKIIKEIELISEDDLSVVTLIHEGNEIGSATFQIADDYIYPESVELDEGFRGIGLYKNVVDFVINNMEDMAGVSEFRSILRTKAANKFWQKYTDVSDYDESEHEIGSQEQIIIDSDWNVRYE